MADIRSLTQINTNDILPSANDTVKRPATYRAKSDDDFNAVLAKNPGVPVKEEETDELLQDTIDIIEQSHEKKIGDFPAKETPLDEKYEVEGAKQSIEPIEEEVSIQPKEATETPQDDDIEPIEITLTPAHYGTILQEQSMPVQLRQQEVVQVNASIQSEYFTLLENSNVTPQIPIIKTPIAAEATEIFELNTETLEVTVEQIKTVQEEQVLANIDEEVVANPTENKTVNTEIKTEITTQDKPVSQKAASSQGIESAIREVSNSNNADNKNNSEQHLPKDEFVNREPIAKDSKENLQLTKSEEASFAKTLTSDNEPVEQSVNNSGSDKTFANVQTTEAKVIEAANTKGNIATKANPSPTPQQQPSANEQIAFSIKSGLSDGKSKISLQLRPEQLGRVDIKIEVTHDGRTTVVVGTERSDTHDMLAKDPRQLAQQLEDAGLDLDSTDISYNMFNGDDSKQANDSESQSSNNSKIAEKDAELIPLSAREILVPRHGGIWSAVA